MPKIYDELAAWWHLLSAPVDSQEEAAFYANTLEAACAQPIRAVLELGSGGGHNASHMNLDLEHLGGDMRTIG